jgi:CHASE3 domain sensor protein
MYHYTTALRQYLAGMLSAHRERFAQARAYGDTGASAVELAIITAVILGIAVALLAVIRIFVTTESGQIHG